MIGEFEQSDNPKVHPHKFRRSLRTMKKFASEYPTFPIWQVLLAKLELLPIREAVLISHHRNLSVSLLLILIQ